MQTSLSGRSFLVTGAAGFIGATVAKQLLTAGANVVGIDNLNDYYDPTLKEHRLTDLLNEPSFRFEKLDIEDQAALGSLFYRHSFDAVLNLAARAGVRASIENPHVYMSTNGAGTLNLLEQMRQHDVKKFVLASTSSLYAGLEGAFVETAAANTPISPYAASKKAAETMAYTYHHLYGIDVSVVRYFTVYGPAGRPDMSPYRFINWVAQGEKIQLFGDGTQTRDFTYVEDIASGSIAALQPVGYEIFNLGSNQPFSLLEMIKKIEHLVGKKAQIELLPMPAADVTATWANTDKARKTLGWQPQFCFDQGLERTWQWHEQYFDFGHVAEIDISKEVVSPSNR